MKHFRSIALAALAGCAGLVLAQPIQAAGWKPQNAVPAEAIQQTLPHTASAMSWLVLIGIFALGAFAILGIRRRNANL